MNYGGFNPKIEFLDSRESDHFFGSMSVPGIGDIPEGERDAYLPVGEVQEVREDTMDCASRGPVNIYEAKFTYAYQKKLFCKENLDWLEDNGYVTRSGRIEFSDRFVAINSGTTREGNSIKAPCETIRLQGLIPKKMLPMDRSMTLEEYYDKRKITKKMVDLGKEFKDRFVLRYEKVLQVHFKEFLKDDWCDVGVHAWPRPVNGEYPKTDAEFNHVVALIRPEYFAFDNYRDSVDNDFVKKLAPDFKFFEYGFRCYILKEMTRKEIDKQREQIMGLLQQIIDLCKKYLAQFGHALGRALYL